MLNIILTGIYIENEDLLSRNISPTIISYKLKDWVSVNRRFCRWQFEQKCPKYICLAAGNTENYKSWLYKRCAETGFWIRTEGVLWQKFWWRRWGSSHLGLCTLDPPLIPQSTPMDFFQCTSLVWGEGHKFWKMLWLIFSPFRRF